MISWGGKSRTCYFPGITRKLKSGVGVNHNRFSKVRAILGIMKKTRTTFAIGAGVLLISIIAIGLFLTKKYSIQEPTTSPGPTNYNEVFQEFLKRYKAETGEEQFSEWIKGLQLPKVMYVGEGELSLKPEVREEFEKMYLGPFLDTEYPVGERGSIIAMFIEVKNGIPYGEYTIGSRGDVGGALYASNVSYHHRVACYVICQHSQAFANRHPDYIRACLKDKSCVVLRPGEAPEPIQ